MSIRARFHTLPLALWLMGCMLPWGLARAQAPAIEPAAMAAPSAADSGRVLGSGTQRFLGFRVFTARLLVRGAFTPAQWTQTPFTLELTYARTLAGRDIARRSRDEMAGLAERRGQKVAPSWLQAQQEAMERLFPDVKEGDVISGRWQPERGSATFSLNGTALGTVADPAFGPLFFGIWLDPATSEPALRERLLGIAR